MGGGDFTIMLSSVLLLCLATVAFASPPWEDREFAKLLDDLPSLNPGLKSGKYPIDEDAEADTEVTDSRLPVIPAVDIIPPKYKPGEVMKGTETKDVNRALDDILKSSQV